MYMYMYMYIHVHVLHVTTVPLNHLFLSTYMYVGKYLQFANDFTLFSINYH